MTTADDKPTNNKQRMIIETEDNYFNFINTCKSEPTKITYRNVLENYLSFNGITTSKMISLSIKDAEKMIIKYLEYMKSKDRSYSRIKVNLAALKHFYDMNDVLLNWKKISKFVGAVKRKNNDRAYTHEEIKRVLDVADLRMKVVILLLASTGIRIGAVASLTKKNLQETKEKDIYKITIYEGDPEEYFVFTTPECKKTIDQYFKQRESLGEILTDSSYLIREQFDINDFEQVRKRAKSVTTSTFKNNIHALLIKSGLRDFDPNYKLGDRRNIASSHGFRKFWTTQVINSKVLAVQLKELRQKMGYES
jgi:integrase